MKIKSCLNCGTNFVPTSSSLCRSGGKYCSHKCYWKSLLGKTAWNKNKKATWAIGEKSVVWKGDDVGYRALHYWVERRLGKPKCCDFCGSLESKRYSWANKSGNYLRDITDWIRLCSKCHYKYDRGRIRL